MFLGKPVQTCIGGRCSQSGGVIIPLKVILPILRHALESAVCMIGGIVVRQIRGAFIGFPLSPPWCMLVAMFAEWQWHSSLSSSQCGLSWQASRYVDNRLVAHIAVHSDSDLDQTCIIPAEIEPFLKPSFYGPPIVLEPEAGLDFVGIRIAIRGLALEGQYIVTGFEELARTPNLMQLPLECRWKYRSPHSAGSPCKLLVF